MNSSLPTAPATCCGLGRAARVIAVAGVVSLAVLVGYLGGRNRSLTESLHAASSNNAATSDATIHAAMANLPTMMIDGREVPIVDASGAVGSEKFSIATGPVADDSEGFFMLDHNSGLLQCQVIYPRLAQVGARYAINVAESLGTGGKGGEYLMLTGRVNFPRASNRPAASVVVYVMDTATGNFVCYGVPFNDSMVNAGRQQSGALVLITQGSANPLIDRDSLR